MFNKNLLSAAIAVITTFGAAQVFAQDAAQDEAIDEIVVSGIKASLMKALEIKKDKIAIVDSIVTEDIGKFPDNNVVESLQRVPGIQVTGRTHGETSGISIRGLNDVYTTVNGRKVFTGVGQAFALQDIPASLLKQVDVYKTRDSSQIETGIAGVVDVKTSRPFDFESSKVVLAGRSVYAEQSGSNDPVVSMLASDRWDTSYGNFGALLNLSKTKITSRDQHINPGAVVPFFSASPSSTNVEGDAYRPYSVIPASYWGTLNTGSGLSTAENATIPVNGVNETYIQGHDAFILVDDLTKRERTGVNLSLQYAPNDSSEYTFETFYNGYDNSLDSNLFLYFFGNAQPGSQGTVATFYPNSNILKSRTYAMSDAQTFTSADYLYGHTDSIMYALAGKWDLTDNLKVKSEIVYQTSTFSDAKNALRLNRTYSQPVAVDYDYSNGLPYFKFLDNPATAFNEEDTTSVDGWKADNAYMGEGRHHGDSTSFTTDASYDADWGVFKSVDFGIRAESRAAEDFTTWGGRGTDIAKNEDLLNIMPGIAHVNKDYFGGEAYLPSSWLNADGFYIKNHLAEFREALNFSLSPMDLQFAVQEDSAAAYVNAKFETELGGKTIDGDVGVRYVNYSTDVQFFQKWNENATVATYSYNTVNEEKLLPSLMVRYHFTDELMARASYTQTIRRPEFGALNPYINFDASLKPVDQLGDATGGNPALKSTESENFDLSLEWYFDEGSSLFGTLFKREITGLVVDTTRQEVHPRAADDPTPWTYVVKQPTNSSDGELTGAELGFIWFPKNLPDLLDGFGLQASYTRLSSSQTIPVTDADGLLIRTDTDSMFTVSDSSYSAVLAYDKYGVGLRLSYAWRSKFRTGSLTSFANPYNIWSEPEESLDLQISYKINDNLEITLDGTNLTGATYQQYYTDSRLVSGYDLISRTFAVGARYTF